MPTQTTGEGSFNLLPCSGNLLPLLWPSLKFPEPSRLLR
jgi:hypothetical protein